jgi:hypothetical protein
MEEFTGLKPNLLFNLPQKWWKINDSIFGVITSNWINLVEKVVENFAQREENFSELEFSNVKLSWSVNFEIFMERKVVKINDTISGANSSTFFNGVGGISFFR